MRTRNCWSSPSARRSRWRRRSWASAAFPETHALSLKWLGMHGTVYANNAVNEADLLLAFGVRFDDRVTGKLERVLPSTARSSTSTSTTSEINKNKVVHLPIQSDVKYALGRLNELLDEGRLRARSRRLQRSTPSGARRSPSGRRTSRSPIKDTEDAIQPQYAIELLYELTKGEAIITTGVGQHQMWAAQFYHFNEPRTLHHQRRPRLDGLRLSRRARREGRLPGQGGHRHRRRRLVPDEHPGTRQRARRRHRRQGARS